MHQLYKKIDIIYEICDVNMISYKKDIQCNYCNKKVICALIVHDWAAVAPCSEASYARHGPLCVPYI